MDPAMIHIYLVNQNIKVKVGNNNSVEGTADESSMSDHKESPARKKKIQGAKSPKGNFDQLANVQKI